jgi:hypothetical protein
MKCKLVAPTSQNKSAWIVGIGVPPVYRAPADQNLDPLYWEEIDQVPHTPAEQARTAEWREAAILFSKSRVDINGVKCLRKELAEEANHAVEALLAKESAAADKGAGG